MAKVVRIIIYESDRANPLITQLLPSLHDGKFLGADGSTITVKTIEHPSMGKITKALNKKQDYHPRVFSAQEVK
jgi:hypothetical protein